MPGFVNTRLAPVLDCNEAAQLHEHMATTFLERCLVAKIAPLELWCAPDPRHRFFKAYGERGVKLETQCGNDLGMRMHNAATAAFCQPEVDHVVVVGTDCPTLDSRYLSHALDELANNDVVIGPAEDGGYGLIGLNRPALALFRGISWSTATVYEDTVARIRSLDYRWLALPELWDVDTPADLQRYQALVHA